MMANQGCPAEGADTRRLGWLICPLQRLLSWRSDRPTRWLIQDLPFFGLGWPPYLVIQWKRSDGDWRLIRAGWRYDVNAKIYIFPTAAFKITDRPMMDGY